MLVYWRVYLELFHEFGEEQTSAEHGGLEVGLKFLSNQFSLFNKQTSGHTVDGQNPAPPGM